ncbi:MAG: UDP-3-O-(3-hydroxymyristoyl)glucosamine N-acyltransferase [Phormidesmis priestleyi]|uniref:UDP-3-O-acylglucosamine N-acyltransferase n=1 Tax=Phormidesmis priestleyi TaxID=268141 RepID=A0A2W4XM00_9CYAN|nr:MAG: UDP-3-O-(3-hydroxymyristoyl)glucosamine N-acyltransferase [Phormidesmis priestleyi]
MKFSQIVAALGDQVTASSLGTDPDIQSLAAIQEADETALSYVEGPKFADYVATTQAGALVLPTDERLQAKATARNLPWVSVKNPRLIFARAIALFYRPFQLPPGIHPTAVIDPSAEIGEDVAIGAHVVVQAGVKVGDRACLHPNVVIYPGVSIGAGTVLHANCVIHERSQIGANCVIHSGAAIGSEGFGFVPTATGWEKMHQSGVTILEDGVEIGCNSAVDRPAVGETRIGRNTKIDNMVHIAHGCKVGEAVAMAAQVGMAGGVTIGNRVILAGQVGIANQAHVGDGAIASAKAGIHHNVAAGTTVSGMPAIPHKLYLRCSALLKRLPDMSKSIKQLQKQIGSDEADSELSNKLSNKP